MLKNLNHKYKNFIFYSISILFEIASIILIYKEIYIFALILHLISTYILTKLFLKNQKKIFFYIFILFMFTPIISFIIVGLLEYLNEITFTEETFQKIDFTKLIFFDEVKVYKRIFGEGAIYEYVNNINLNPDMRLKIFIILSDMITPLTIKLLKKGLSDPIDEVRMLSFSVINSLEEKLNKQLMNLTDNLQIAKIKWEFIYLNLVDENFENIILNEIIDLLKNNSSKEVLEFLLKIYLRKKDYKKIEEILNTLGLNKLTAPYFAEIFYYKKEYKKVREIFIKYPELKQINKFYYLSELWNDN